MTAVFIRATTSERERPRAKVQDADCENERASKSAAHDREPRSTRRDRAGIIRRRPETIESLTHLHSVSRLSRGYAKRPRMQYENTRSSALFRFIIACIISLKVPLLEFGFLD